MFNKIKQICKSAVFAELVAYGVVGVLTTLVNIVSFALLNGPLRAALGISQQSALYLTGANVIANVLSIVFAFFANKRYVFKSDSWERRTVWREAAQFAVARIFAMLLDIGVVNLCVLALHWDDLVAKIAANVLVIVVNYVTGKLWVFRRR